MSLGATCTSSSLLQIWLRKSECILLWKTSALTICPMLRRGTKRCMDHQRHLLMMFPESTYRSLSSVEARISSPEEWVLKRDLVLSVMIISFSVVQVDLGRLLQELRPNCIVYHQHEPGYNILLCDTHLNPNNEFVSISTTVTVIWTSSGEKTLMSR